MRIRTTLTAALAFWSVAAQSDCVPGYCIGRGTEVVQSATVTETGVFFVMPQGASLGCNLIEGVYAKLEISHPLFAALYATYLNAIATNGYFQVGMTSAATCTVSYVRMWNGA